MSESSIFWDTSGGGDGGAEYTQAQLVAWLRRIFTPTPASEGVHKGYSNELAVSGASSPLSVAAGAATVYGFPYESTGVVSLAVSTPGVGTTGGHVVLRVDWAAQTVRLAAVRNTAGVSSAPAVTQVAGTTWEIRLATFTITTGGVITVTDARTYCHYTTMVSTAMLEALAVTGAKLAADSVDDTKAGNRVPQFYRRQGGNASDWDAVGSTGYTPTAVRIQAGVYDTGSFGGGANVPTVITFPVPFSHVPIVLASVQSRSLITVPVVASAHAISASQVTINADTGDGSLTSGSAEVAWLAIGPE